jgi:hypothetical protein
MARTLHEKAKATNGMHQALYFWYFATVAAAAIGGGLFFGHWGAPLLEPGTFSVKAFAGLGFAAAILGAPVMVFFSLGERILFEVMDLNDDARRADDGLPRVYEL